MNERNYLVVEVYPTGATRVIAQLSDLDAATFLLGELVSRYYDPRNLFAIRTINVNGSESVSRYENENYWNRHNENEEES